MGARGIKQNDLLRSDPVLMQVVEEPRQHARIGHRASDVRENYTNFCPRA